MDLSQPPQDEELKNIIDKLAQFVARNGQEFEQMTKTKQKDNQKFSFLFGGEFYNYYQYKVTTEQAVLKHRQTRDQQGPQQQHGSHQQQIPHQDSNISQQQSGQNPYNPQDYPAYNYQGAYNQNQGPNTSQYDNYQQQYPMGQQTGDLALGGGSLAPPPPQIGSYTNPYDSGDTAYPSGDASYPPYQQNVSTEMLQQQAGYAGQGTGDPMYGSASLGQQPPLAMNSDMPSSQNNGYQQPLVAPNGMAMANQVPQPTLPDVEALKQQIATLREQITQSEENLEAQRLVLEQQKAQQIRESCHVARYEALRKEAASVNIKLLEFEEVLVPIMESCTKDAIANGKQWIFTNAQSEETNMCIAKYLLYKATSVTAIFTHKLHVIYLMNDVMHHCLRKSANDLKSSLEKVLAPMYCHAVTCASDDQKSKLDKLLSLWKSKMHLDSTILDELQSPAESWAIFEKEIENKFPQVAITVAQHLTTAMENFEQQHNAFVAHANTQVIALETQKTLADQQIQAAADAAVAATSQPPVLPGGDIGYPNISAQVGTSQQPPFNASSDSGVPLQPPLPPGPGGPMGQGMEFNQPPPGFPPSIDFSKPPPGFPQTEITSESLIPAVPYFELPAGLMGLVISPDESKYRPVDPKLMRLPMPTPPSERLLHAVDMFYQPPSHERPRNCEGWEQLGLYDYYKAKSTAVREKERLMEQNLGEKSRSPSPVIIEKEEDLPDDSEPIRRYRSESPVDERFQEPPPPIPPQQQQQEPPRDYPRRSMSPEPRTPVRRGRSRTPPRSPRRRSRSPQPRRRSRTRSKTRSRSRERSRERSKERSRSRRRSYSRSKSRSRTRSRTRSRSRSRPKSPPIYSYKPYRARSTSRSPTPPVISFATSQAMSHIPGGIDSSNKGHQMLQKMGWSGTGLGAKEQGISAPIESADVRDSGQERFRGLGVPTAKSDPYEAFRKNKGQAFINRMKARAEDRA